METKEVKKCNNCNNVINGRGVKFCSQSCNAKYHNKHRIKKIEKQCVGCDKMTINAKYCSKQCQQVYQKQIIFEKIENGDTSLEHRNYRRYLIHTYGNKCMECNWCEINQYTKKVPIELEHIDGDSTNNSLDNLKLLCPNCHSLTSTYKALNKGNGRYDRMVRYNEGKSY